MIIIITLMIKMMKEKIKTGQGYGRGIGGCNELCPVATGLSLVILFSLSVSIEDHPLLWMVVRSQTYYPEHILTYGSGNARCSLIVGSSSFRTDSLEAGRSKHHTESGTQVWGLGVQV